MGKTDKRLQTVVDRFIAEMSDRYPGLDQSFDFQDRGGYKAWVFMKVPEELMPKYWEIEDAAFDLFERLYEETGLNILGHVVATRPDLIPARGK